MASPRENEGGQSDPKGKLTRLGSFSSREVFWAWANDSLLKPSTIETLMEVHEIDSLPAVLALRSRDIANLGLPIGQARLFEEAVMKLHTEYKYQEPPSPATRVDVEFPRYKSLLEDTELKSEYKTRRHFTFDNGKNISKEIITESEETFCDGDSRTEEKLLNGREIDDETQSGCACERWLFIVIFMPIIIVFSVLGLLVWIVLWPVKRFCPVGDKFSKLFKTTETLIKSPVAACQWAIGRRGTDLVSNEGETKRNYGGTNDIQMKELERTD